LVGSYILILVVCLCLIGAAIAALMPDIMRRVTYLRLEPLANWGQFTIQLQLNRGVTLKALSENWRQSQALSPLLRRTRVLMLNSDGTVLADSSGELERQQFVDAPLSQREASRLSRGDALLPDGETLLWVGVPLRLPDRGPRLYLVVAAPPQESQELLQLIWRRLLVAGVVGLALSLALAWAIGRSIVKPLRKVTSAAEEVARGNYDLHLDLTSPDEVQRVATSFNTMTEAVKSSQQVQRDFVANVSHELKTPLTSIQGFSQAILDGTASDPQSVRQAAGVIHDEAGRMTRMVSQLLDLAKIEAGQIVMARESVDLKAVLEGCVTKLAPQAAESDVSLGADLAQLPASTRVTGDGDRLAQVFIILLDNALKHTPPGGKVTVAARCAEAAQVQVSVSDTGPGIPAQDLPRIFERFYQVDKSRARGKGGTGLGLAIAKEVVTAHGGEIVVQSIAAMGSQFTVRLPSPSPSGSDA
jgi:signal transduction histidine kinase